VMEPPRGNRPDHTGFGQDDSRLGTADLTDTELADALWFAAVRAKAEEQPATRDATPRGPQPGTRPGPDRDGESAPRGGTTHDEYPPKKIRARDRSGPDDIDSAGEPYYGGGSDRANGDAEAVLARREWRPAADQGQPSLIDRTGITRSLRSLKRVVASRWEVE
jgi:hypothetical protein